MGGSKKFTKKNVDAIEKPEKDENGDTYRSPQTCAYCGRQATTGRGAFGKLIAICTSCDNSEY